MTPFRNILHLSVGDFLAKTLNFLVFVYLARVFGVASYGILEFAGSILTYFMLLADGGLELWATREAAQGKDMRQLVARIVPLRFLLAVGAFGALLILLPAFPNYPAFKTILVLFGLTVFAQAASLKWVFMGQEKMTRVAVGVLVAQIVFALLVFGMVRRPAEIVWVPILRLAAEIVMVAFFLRLFAATHGGYRLAFTLRGARKVLQPALVMGASHGLALVMYNLDSVLLGFFLGPAAVGWYNAAYKPVTVALAIPVTYFLGLLPALSRAFAESREAFSGIVASSLRLTSVFALPLGVGGTFLAEAIIDMLFGPAYANSVPAFQVLSWSAVLVILRGTYRQALNAAGRADLDLRCAGASTAVNVGLNLALIPRYGIIGAAAATLVGEVIWLITASYSFSRHVARVSVLPVLLRPIAAALAMGIFYLQAQALAPVVRATIGVVTYFGVLLLLNQTEVRSWVQTRNARVS